MLNKRGPTTNNTTPVTPSYPWPRKGAKGPIITTHDVDRVAVKLGVPIPVKVKPARKAKADE